jgi:capsular polysaccharide export protein
VNSTAAQQALWRNLPVYALGRSVFAKPELVSGKPLAEFFAEPDAPDAESYNYYRKFLLETSQIGGGYYTQRGRAELLRRLVDLMLSKDDAYLTKLESKHSRGASLKLVGGADSRIT